MRKIRNALLTTAGIVALPLALVQISNAQISNEIMATIHHPFIIGNTTLPPGKYDFRMLTGSDLTVMTVRSADDKIGEEFLVRDSSDKVTPTHSELVFDRYGNKEFLSKIYEDGSRAGIAVDEPSREELRLQKAGESPVEHSEMQTQ